jgi:antagonist of KipI
MSIQIRKKGILDTFQDQGRNGFASWGINPNGAMDGYAAQIANALVANDPSQAVLEIHFPSCEISFLEDHVISITGADFTPQLDGSRIPLWSVVHVKKGQCLAFKNRINGSRCYLAVHGGFSLQPWLRSFSTHIKARAGGFEGRTLMTGDIISVHPGKIKLPHGPVALPWHISTGNVYASPKEIAFVEGAEWNFLQGYHQQFLDQPYTISSSSDRMGYRLDHHPFTIGKFKDRLSSGVTFGTIQLLPGGKLIILMADHQTTGGYPRPGYIASAHLPKLSQLSAGESFHLVKISAEESEKMLLSLRQLIQRQYNVCKEKLISYANRS